MGILLVWPVLAILSCLIVLWMSGLFGRLGALISTAVLIAVGLGFVILMYALGPGLHLLWNYMFPPPLIVGALAGLATWWLKQPA